MVSAGECDPVEQHSLANCHNIDKTHSATENASTSNDPFSAKLQHHLTDFVRDSRVGTDTVYHDNIQHVLADCDETVPLDKGKQVSFETIEHATTTCEANRRACYNPNEGTSSVYISCFSN